ncbi:nuclear pore complex protein Nup88 [Anabrus simplex]|uniref:nuclear pore complex protein Nup88 n=1 Tax=Anabrus simplex TaxID=316456 RepID=UPI0035A3625A
MEFGTDYLGLADHKLFEIVRESLSLVKIKTQNIIDCKNDILFVWNALDQNILTLNLKNVKENPNHQTLLPTDPPCFSVETLLVNETASQVALAGPQGVAVLSLPKRWGKAGAFHGGKEVISCRCRGLDDRYFACHPYIEVRRVRWHPGSPTDSHLVVLSSENTLRLYETADSGPELLKVWGLGPAPQGSLSTAPRLPFLVGLGDTAIDFDFTPPVPVQADKKESSTGQENTNAIEWPILVLHGNGDIVKVTASLINERSACRVVGPLSMYPSTDDNYGTDMCSLLVLPTLPPIVVIASSAGTLFHCLLLNDTDQDDSQPEENNRSWSRCGSTYSLHTPDVALFVLECVELELGITLDDDSDTVTCPIHLRRHAVTNKRYLCSHDAGIHSVSLPVVSQLSNFIEADEASMDLHLPTLNQPSTVEYLVCTRTSASEVLSPILGVAFSQTPTLLLILLGTGEMLSMAVPSMVLESTTDLENESAATEGLSPLKRLLKEPFDVRIKNMLKHELTQPILKLGGGNNPSAQECMELVMRTTQLFREDYFQRHERVREEIERRVRTLQSLKKHQLQELSALESEKASLQQAAETLAEKYEDAKDKQEELNKRAAHVLRMTIQKQPVMSVAEKKLSKELAGVEEKLKEFRKGLEQIRNKQAYHREQTHQWHAQARKRDVYLNQNRASTIRSSLSKMTEEIADLVQVVHTLKQELAM